MKPETRKHRIDEIIVIQGLAESRSQAKSLILEGKIYVNDEQVLKPSRLFEQTVSVRLENPPKYVSRAGEKLESFITHYPIETYNKTCLDIGASTGGFTDFLLQNGAQHVTCLDVGHSQLHKKLLGDSRIRNIEKTNARDVRKDQLPYPHYDIIVIDVSFISLKKILPNIWQFLKNGGTLVALIKPQFEANPEEVGAGKGVIKKPAIHQRIIEEIKKFCVDQLTNSEYLSLVPSNIKGTDGNQEFLIGIKNRYSLVEPTGISGSSTTLQ